MSLTAGPLTLADLEAEWLSAVDPTYSEALRAAADGLGLEVHEVLWVVLERVSRAIDTTTQSLFILPWSGQTGAPAAGEARAQVSLTLSRSALTQYPLVLGAGLFLVGERQRDWSREGGVDVETGRLYVLLEDAVFPPGDAGPRVVLAEATVPGAGPNNPLPGTIAAVEQVGAALHNILATVTVVGSVVTVVSANLADQFVPEHVGQYVRFLAGANVGKVARVRTFLPPSPGVGSAVTVEQSIAFEASVHALTFMPGETATFSGGQVVTVLGTAAGGAGLRVVAAHVSGNLATVAAGDVLTGATSGATATVAVLTSVTMLSAEIATAEWEILDWVGDFAIASTNATSPAGGRLGMLDELGAERNLPRAPGESDVVYRARVSTIADVVSPGAVKRTLSKTLGPVPYCFREVGSTLLPGFFYDGDNTAPAAPPHGAQNDAYDTDVFVLTGTVTSGAFSLFQEQVVLRAPDTTFAAKGYLGKLTAGDTRMVFIRTSGALPASLVGATVTGLHTGAVFTTAAGSVPASVGDRRMRLNLDYTDFRAFFLVGVPPVPPGALWGAFTWGDGTIWGPDTAVAVVYRSAWQAVDAARAAGVTFDFYEETIGCEG